MKVYTSIVLSQHSDPIEFFDLATKQMWQPYWS